MNKIVARKQKNSTSFETANKQNRALSKVRLLANLSASKVRLYLSFFFSEIHRLTKMFASKSVSGPALKTSGQCCHVSRTYIDYTVHICDSTPLFNQSINKRASSYPK